jgi:acetylornithine deacetylase/succinyl-diaminopimelate desuccinylase-like protein
MPAVKPAELEHVFEAQQERYLREWMNLLRFQSIGTDPAHDQDCLECAAWLRDHLASLGFDASFLMTSGKPVVFAEREGDRDGPTVLFYGHYDVQPVDPIDGWDSPPFEPTLRGRRVYARGAQDNKGQLFYVLKAIEALLEANVPLPTLKVVLEGEEESGSEGMTHALPDWHDRLRADVLMVTDTGTVPSGAPTIVMGLRGVIFVTAVLHGPDHDLHSGVHGGLAPNPAAGMARLVASLHGADGAIAVDGFADGITAPTSREMELCNAEPFDADAYERETGIRPIEDGRGLSPAERVGFQPTIEVNGLASGYAGTGAKTIIPSRAVTKLSARLVPGQDPEQALASLVTHLNRHTPPGLRLDIEDQGSGGEGFRLKPDSALVQRARRVLDSISDQRTALLWEGASIPIVSTLARVSGAAPLLVGFGSEADRIHAPNESFSLDQFRRGFLYAASMLREFAGDWP